MRHLAEHTAIELRDLYTTLQVAQEDAKKQIGQYDPRVAECGNKIRRILQDLGMTVHDIANTVTPGMSADELVDAVRTHLQHSPQPRKRRKP